MSHTIEITEGADGIPSDTVLNDESHSLTVKVGTYNNDVHLEFSSRESLRDFAKTLLHESYYGSGAVELYPLGTENGWLVVDGVRLTEKSSRVFIWYPTQNT
ncbi:MULTISPECIES: hypothetical protein [Cellvibrio]|uniref:Uncharacterized protein n=1 Tax=Cellvibrio fibrivorans TaxID=126350 RepID=A0ABU1V465_9GAMM|nr:hypothetical protein [Cellvibrio fibrivorans]MDR7092259.1 hypothetical protein [Cellvibrio fibrivorans]